MRFVCTLRLVFVLPCLASDSFRIRVACDCYLRLKFGRVIRVTHDSDAALCNNVPDYNFNSNVTSTPTSLLTYLGVSLDQLPGLLALRPTDIHCTLWVHTFVSL